MFCFNELKAQIFSWKNPNLIEDNSKIDSTNIQNFLFIKSDSLGYQFGEKNPNILKFKTLNFKHKLYLADEKLSNRFSEMFTNDSLYLKQKEIKISLGKQATKTNTSDDFFNQLNAKGSFIRGLSFGNNQGSSVQSSMEMQISGKLNKDVKILASITDHNLPVQADGYTQSLQEFDKIYLQLNLKKNTELRAGHLDLTNNSSFFGKYQRRGLGMQLLQKWGINGQDNQFMISASFARSEFNRMRFQAIEGNQGPYRLIGKNNESFITVLSGSEQVYIDGILMKRGENLDYTINYNTGEVTFTSFRPVFSQNFVVISYNYTNRNFNRYLVTSALQSEHKNWKFNLDYFLENDQKNAPLQQNFTTDDVNVLKLAGNNPDLMYSSSEVETLFSLDKILYKKVQAGSISFFEYSTNPQDVLYSVNFSLIGQNKGDYIIKQSLNNGRVFEYVGLNNGNYIAARKLVAPTQSQVLSFSGDGNFANGRVGADFAYSFKDLNTFSELDNDKNNGFASRIWINQDFKYKKIKIQPQIEFHHINQNFLVLDRIQNISFWRDFNLENEFSNRNQNRVHFELKNTWENKNFANIFTDFINEAGTYKGLKNEIDFHFKSLKSSSLAKISLLLTKSPDLNTEFVRANLEQSFFRNKNAWILGASLEHNLKKINKLDKIDLSSFAWKEIFIERKFGDTLSRNFALKSYFRVNDSVRNESLQKVNQILGFVAQSQIIKTTKSLLSASLHYRKFFEIDNKNQEYFIGNVVYNQNLMNNAINIQSFYELGNGQEAQKEFQYIKVIDGKGLYKWTDYNGDGLQQLEEFEIAEFADLAQYIRVYTNNLKYVASNKNKLQLAISIQPAQVFSSNHKLIKRISINSSLLSQNSYLKANRLLVANPFENNDFQILKSQNLIFSMQLNPTKTSPLNAQYKWSENHNQLLVNFSKDTNINELHWLSFGYQLKENFKFDWINQYKSLQSLSQLFINKRFEISEWNTLPKISYNLAKNLMAVGEYKYQNKKRIDGVEALVSNQFSLVLQFDSEKTNLKTSFSYINNQFVGPNFSLVANQMLEGLKPNQNLLWNLNIQRKINRFMMLNINYDGRQSTSDGVEKVIHIGSVQIKALF